MSTNDGRSLRSIRRKGRVEAFQALFEADLVGHDPLEVLERRLVDRVRILASERSHGILSMGFLPTARRPIERSLKRLRVAPGSDATRRKEPPAPCNLRTLV